MQGFDIYFLGETLPDADPAMVRQGVARLFKIDPTAVERLFSGKAVRVKQGVDADAASRYRAAFRDVGALVQIVPEGSAIPKPKPTTTKAVGDQATQGDSRPVRDAGMTLAEPGAIIDPSSTPPPAEIDTGGLEALPPNTGSLEDCQVEKPPRPIPDISHMRLVDD